MKALAFLKITSWRGVSIGAVHYYGSIRHNSEFHELKRTLTKSAAKRLNDQQGERFWEKGHETNGFDAEAEILALALKLWEALCPGALVLIKGNHVSADPQPCIAGDPEIMRKINEWDVKANALGRWDGDETLMTEVSDEYWDFVCALNK